jgi:hypothetical protein
MEVWGSTPHLFFHALCNFRNIVSYGFCHLADTAGDLDRIPFPIFMEDRARSMSISG